LPNGRTLYALLRDKRQVDAANWYAHRAISTPIPTEKSHFLGVWRARWMEDNDARGELRRDLYPMLVTFSNADHPKSVIQVDHEDLKSTFGEGYALRRVRVEITDDEVTTGIEKRLGWLSEFPEPRLDPDYR